MNAAVARVSYRIPARTIELGTVLDLDVTDGSRRVFIDDWRNWLMLADENGLDGSPGRTRLYLVKVPPRVVPLDPNEQRFDRAAETLERWQQREADFVTELDGLPDEISHYQGRVTRIGYRSDKWNRRGKAHDYDHDCRENGAKPPMLYTSHAGIARARAAVIVGGTLYVSERGIE